MSKVRDRDIETYFDDKAGCCSPEKLGWRPIDRPTRVLEQELIALGVAGKTVLELGCGTGELVRDLIRAGASRAIGVDISPNSVARARGAAAGDGLAGVMTFVAGNAVTTELAQHDVVVHDKVVCCYPEWEPFIEHSLGAAREICAFSMPRTDGPWALLTRAWIGIENVLHRLHRRGFRAHAHDSVAIDRAVTRAGFALRRRRTTGGWLIAIYGRE